MRHVSKHGVRHRTFGRGGTHEDGQGGLREGRWRRTAALAGLTTALGAAGMGAFSATALAGTGAPSGSCAVLHYGSTGRAVAYVQRVVGTTPDGDFGPLTRAAVSAFQRAHRLGITGEVDQQTWAALPRTVEIAGCGAPVSGATQNCPQLTYGSTGIAVAVLQGAVGAATDGDFGPLTRAALESAQGRLHLPVTGTATPATWSRLHLVGTPACTAATTAATPSPAPSPSKPPTTSSKTTSHAPSDAAAQAAVRARVLSELATLAREPASAHSPVAWSALAFAVSQRGKPYQWGGTGPAGYDCSGLVLASYRAAGINLLRTAAQQYTTGAMVPLTQLQPGDILFWASDLTKPSTIYHDALYVGGGKLIHAPYTGTVVQEQQIFSQDLMPMAVRPATLLHLPLAEGAWDWSVVQLQEDLTAAGHPLVADGAFGPLTAGAVRAAQSAARLPVTGVVDQATWSAIAAAAQAKRG